MSLKGVVDSVGGIISVSEGDLLPPRPPPSTLCPSSSVVWGLPESECPGPGPRPIRAPLYDLPLRPLRTPDGALGGKGTCGRRTVLVPWVVPESTGTFTGPRGENL